MAETEIVKAETQQLETELNSLKSQLEAIVVVDTATCLQAKQGQRTVRDYMKLVHSRLDAFVLFARKAHDDAKGEVNRYIGPAEMIDASLAEKVKIYERKERERTEADQRRQQEEQRIETARKAEEERLERNRVAEIERKEKEKQAEIERKERDKELARQREAGEINKREMEKQQKIAREKAEADKKAAAEAAEREKERAAKDAVIAAANVPEIKVQPDIPKMQGVPSRRNFNFRITDESLVPRKWMMVNERALKAEAQRTKGGLSEIIPGVEFYEE